MGLSIEQLRADLLARWQRAFRRMDELAAALPRGTQKAFTTYPAFALESYTPTAFKPGARVSKKRTAADDYEFTLDATGRPLRVRYRHAVNRVSWQGFYRYAPDEVEHVEFCTQTATPSLYNRLVLSGDTVVAEQRFVCNAGGSQAALTRLATPAAKAKHVLADPMSYFVYLTLYRVSGGVTRSADEYHEVSGTTYRPRREYTYGDSKLQRIVQHWPDGETRTLFVSRSARAARRS